MGEDPADAFPSYVKRGLSLVDAPTEINRNGGTATFNFDVPGGDAKAREGIDFLLGEAAGASPKDPAKVSPALANNGVDVFLGGTRVGGGAAADGRAKVDVTLPGGCSAPTGAQTLTFKFAPSWTIAHRQVNITGDDSSCAPAPTKHEGTEGIPSPHHHRPISAPGAGSACR